MNFTREDTKIIKAIAIFLMLYHHLFGFPDRIHYKYISLFNYHGQSISYLIGRFGKLCVALFLFLGGYGAYKSYKKNNNNFVKNKLKALYTNYWKVFIFVVPVSFILKVPTIKKSIVTFFWNLSGLKISYNLEWWFFTIYIILIIITPLLIKLLEKIRLSELYVFMLLILFSSFSYFIYPKIFELNIFSKYANSLLHINLKNTMTWAPCYISGLLFAKYNILDYIKSKISRNFITNIIALIILVFIFFIRKKTGNLYDYILAPLFIICTINILSWPIFKVIKKFLIKIGNQSTNIWLIHSFYCYWWCQKLIFKPKYSILIFLTLLIISYITGIIIDKIFSLIIKLMKFIKRKSSLRIIK